MKKIILLIVVCSIYQTMYAQDTIYDRKNYSVLAKVLEITNTDIKYKRFDNPEGPVYSTPKNQVSIIKYANGSIEDFSSYTRQQVTDRRGRPINTFIPKGDKMISAGFWAFVTPSPIFSNSSNENNSPVSAAYVTFEKLFAQNHIGITIMPFIGFNKKAYGSAFGFAFYPKNYGRAQFRLEPQYIFSVQDYSNTTYNSTNQYYETKRFQTTISYLLFNLGFNVNASQNWVITNNFGFGMVVGNSNYKKYYGSNYNGSNSAIANPVLSYRIGLAYRFK